MAIRLAQLSAATRTIQMPFDGETVNLTYRIGEVNTGEAVVEERESLVEWTARVVDRWDVIGADGEPIATTEDSLRANPIPTVFLRQVMLAVLRDGLPGNE